MMNTMEKILDDQLTDAVMTGRVTPETAEWWRHLPYSGDKAREWYDKERRWQKQFADGQQPK